MEGIANAQDLSPDDIIIPVMGITGSGKSTFIARCSGSDAAVGHGLKSCTKEVSYATFRYKNRTIRLIDTPGFDDSDEEDSKIFKEISYWLLAAYASTPPLLISGIIYLHPITNVRMKGTDKNNLAMFQALCGKESWSFVVMATTMWGKLDPATGQKRQTTIAEKYWNDLIDAGATVTTHEDTKDSALRIIDRIIDQDRRVVLKVQHELSTGTELLHTDAGQELNRKLNEERELAEKRVAEVREDIEDAQQRGDIEDTKELLEMKTQYEKAIQAKDLELQKMRMDIDLIIKERAEEVQKAERARTEQNRVAQEQHNALTEQLEALRLSQTTRDAAPANYQAMNLSDPNEAIQALIRENELRTKLDQERHEAELARHEEMLKAAQLNNKYAKRGVAVDSTSAAIGLSSLAVSTAQLALTPGCQVM